MFLPQLSLGWLIQMRSESINKGQLRYINTSDYFVCIATFLFEGLFNNVISTFDLFYKKRNHFSWALQKVFLGHKLPRYLLHQLPSWGPGPIFEVTYHLHAQGLIHQNQKHQGHARAKFFFYCIFSSLHSLPRKKPDSVHLFLKIIHNTSEYNRWSTP